MQSHIQPRSSQIGRVFKVFNRMICLVTHIIDKHFCNNLVSMSAALGTKSPELKALSLHSAAQEINVGELVEDELNSYELK